MTLPSLIHLAIRALHRRLQAMRLRSASDELHSMPDYLLKDMGISQSSIPVVGHGCNEIVIFDHAASEAPGKAPVQKVSPTHSRSQGVDQRGPFVLP